MTDDRNATLQKLRDPFPADAVGKLPRLTCKACSNASDKHCDRHQKSRCSECGNWISSAHMHLDYIGHANVTARLLNVDPEWTWEPVAFDDQGNPALIRNQQGAPIGLWIKLTVGGITRFGFGSCEANKFDPVKELIGDALRNAAMRFGVALDLWSKEELEVAKQDSPEATPVSTPPKSGQEQASGGDVEAKPQQTESAVMDSPPAVDTSAEGDVAATTPPTAPSLSAQLVLDAVAANHISQAQVIAKASRIARKLEKLPEKGIAYTEIKDLDEEVLKALAEEVQEKVSA